MKNKIFVSVIVTLAMLSGPMYSFAQTTGTTSVSSQVQSLLDQIKSLQTQIQTLQALQEQIVKAQGEVSQSLKLIRSLREGMSGDDVKALQTILAADTSIYPEGLLTGFYGRLTSEAVKKFQKKYGIEMLGLVGPKTLKKLNEEIDKLSLSQEDDDNDEDNDGDKKDKKFCVPPGHLIAPGWLKKNDKPTISECKTFPKGIEKKLNDNDDQTTTDTTAPVISEVTTSNLLATTTNIVWTTNEKSNSKIWFGTTTPLVTTSPAAVSSSAKVTSHSLSLSGLATSTTYYYVVGSSDEKGNTATSSQNSFVTLSN